MAEIPYPKRIRLPDARYRDPATIVHVTVRLHAEAPPLEGALGTRLWRCVLEQRQRQHVSVFAACLMPDHLHLLVAPRRACVVAWLGSFKSFTTHLSWQFGRRGPLWQPSFYDRLMRDRSEMEATVNYIVGNPAAAGPRRRWRAMAVGGCLG